MKSPMTMETGRDNRELRKTVLLEQKPFYLQIKDILTDRIARGLIKSNEPIPSLHEISKSFGVSMITARQAVKALVDDGMLYVAIGKGTFVKEMPYKTITLGVLANLPVDSLREEPSLETPLLLHFKEWMDSLSSKAPEFNCVLAYLSRSQWEEKLINLMETSRISGIIILGIHNLEDELLDLIKKKGLAYVVLGDTCGRKDIVSVSYSDYIGGFKAAQHLAHKGHTAIGILAGKDQYYGYRERLRGYKDGLAQGGIEEKNISIVVSESGVSGGYLAARELLNKPVLPSALLCCSDFKAFGAIKAAKERGLRIPEEMAIVGYDDLTLSNQGDLPLTTVRIPKQPMAREGLRLLTNLVLKRESVAKVLQQEMEPDLVIRKTA